PAAAAAGPRRAPPRGPAIGRCCRGPAPRALRLARSGTRPASPAPLRRRSGAVSRLYASLPDWKALLAVPPIRPSSLGTDTAARGECTMLLVGPAVSHRAGAEVSVYGAQLSSEACRELGFSSNLLCSSCNLLGQFNLNQLDPFCRECCQEEAQLETRKLYAGAVLEVCG
uniref:Selenoprotein F n=1 Tax=Taeniopygia guttata TaxID=59729 RepID=H0Z7F2_TAEGU